MRYISNTFSITAQPEVPAARDNILYCTMFEPLRLSRWLRPTSSDSVINSTASGDYGIDGHNAYQMLAKAGTYCDISQILTATGSASSANYLLKPSTWYTLSFRCRGARQHVNSDGSIVTVDRNTQLVAYVYPGIVDTTKKILVDGEWQYPTGDMRVVFDINWTAQTHTVTFKTASTFGGVPRLLFRSFGEGYSGAPSGTDFSNGGFFVRIATPKIEEGEEATAYIPHSTEMLQPYTSRVYKYSTTTPSKPSSTSASYYSPVPSGWSDGIPETSEGILWTTSAKLFPEASSATWETPSVERDTTTSDIEFAYETTNGEMPKAPNDSNRHGSTKQIWFDPVLDAGASWTQMKWRAERTITNGQYGEWAITSIKGENGIHGSSPMQYRIQFTSQVCNVDKSGVCHISVKWQVVRIVGSTQTIITTPNNKITTLSRWRYSGSETWHTATTKASDNSVGIADTDSGDGKQYVADLNSPANIEVQYLYNNSVLANAFVPFIVSGQDGISADPASVFIVDTDIKSIPCNSNGVAKTGASLTVSAYERDTNGNMSAISPLFMQMVYYYTPNVQHGSAMSSPIYQGTVSNGVKTVEIPSTMNNVEVFANKIQIDVYKNNNPTSNLIKTITLYPLLDGQQGVQGPTGEEGKPLPTMLVSTPTLGFTLAQEEYGSVVGDASVRLTALYGESSKNTIYEVWDNFQPASTSGEHWRQISSNSVYVGICTNESAFSDYYWRFSCRVENDSLVITPKSVDSKAINGDYNCVLRIRAKHPSYSEYITTDYCFYVVRRGQKGEARSYTPYLMGVYNENTRYVWDGKRRDFVYYPATKDGKKIYYIWGVKEYGMDFTNKTPGKTYPNDTHNEYWEQGDVYTLLVTNCIFADNAVLGGMKFTDQRMTSSDVGENIVIDGNSGEFKANKAIIRGEVNATAGTFKNVKITNNCWIEPETQDGDGWFMNGGNDRKAAWRFGYSGKLTGQFTMNTVYDNGSNHPPTASLSFKTPNIQGGTSDGAILISAYSNINTPLANFSHANGVMVRICPSEGVGMSFIDNVGNANPIAFNGKGHGALNGVIQGYKLNVMSSGQIDISKGNTVYCNGNGTNLILPTRENCSNVLGTTGAFALDLTIIGASGARDFRVYGKRHNSTTGYTTDCYLLNNDHGDNWYATMSQGDVLTLKLIYTGTSFYAYIVNMQN